MDPIAVAPAVAAEHVYLNERGVLVSSARIVAEGHTYALRNITSVRARRDGLRRLGPSLVIIVGLVMLFGDAATAGGLIALAGLAWAILGRRTHVVIATAAGESRAFSAFDKAFIVRVIEAVNSAIVHGAR